MLAAEKVRAILSYEPDSGVFTWRARDGSGRNDKCWNAMRASTRAGRLTPRGYRMIGIEGRYYQAHRLAWLYMHGEWPPDEIDHIDGNRDNNAFSNLRAATRSQNAMNRRKRSGCTSRFKGVNWHPVTGKWAASIKVGGKSEHLGLFDTEEDASLAYEERARLVHGEFAQMGNGLSAIGQGADAGGK